MKFFYLLINLLFSYKLIYKIPRSRKFTQLLKLTFIPTKLKKLPKTPHPIFYSEYKQVKYIERFNKYKIQTSFSTCKDLIKILKKRFVYMQNFSFLDYGGENIDFFLHFKKEFPKANYYVYNQREILSKLALIKKKYNFKDLNIIQTEKQIFLKKFDFVNFGSTIQYINNYKNLILKILKISKKYIFFSGITFYKSGTFIKKNSVVMQVNLVPSILYCFIFEKRKFIETFQQNKFTNSLNRNCLTDKISFSNLYNFENLSYHDILFKKL